MDKQKVLKVVLSVTLYIALLGSLNWGLQALNMNAVELLVGKDNTMALNVVYYTVALCGLVAGVLYTMHLLKKKDDKDK
jgi:uncharacterized membrane protein YuzA (DUF378 family)